MLHFFGLAPEYKIELYKSIFNMITFGKGGWTYSDICDMPVYLRNFYFNEMKKSLAYEAKVMGAATGTTQMPDVVQKAIRKK